MPLIGAGLKEFQLTRPRLALMPKRHANKIALAFPVKSHTVMTNGWIAQQLAMGEPSRVSRYCYQAETRADVKPHIKRLEMSMCKVCPEWR